MEMELKKYLSLVQQALFILQTPPHYFNRPPSSRYKL